MYSSYWRNSEALLRTLFLLFMGQVISFVMSISGFTSSLVANHGVDTPLTLGLLSYLAITLVYGSIFLYRRKKLLIPWYWYQLLGFVDVQGNYLVNKAFQYTSITSVTIMDCWTIAWVMILTWFLLGTRYSLWQFFGVAVCVRGLGSTLVSDSGVGGGGGSKSLLGDILVIAGTLFFAVSNVGEEICVKKKDTVEVVSMIGLFGTLVSLFEIAILERKKLESVKWSAEIILAFAGYALSCFMFYSFVPFVLKMSGATMFNLSLLTSDMWAVVIRIFIYHQKVDWLYYLSFAIVTLGLVIYTKFENDPDRVPSLEHENLNAPYQALPTETADSGNEATDSLSSEKVVLV